MYACMHACMYVCMYACMYACMYVRMYVSSLLLLGRLLQVSPEEARRVICAPKEVVEEFQEEAPKWTSSTSSSQQCEG